MKSKFQKLTVHLDEVFGNYIRYRDSGKCFTCGMVIDPEDRQRIHPGHVFSRKYRATRWDEDNVFAQCPPCNLQQHFDGNGSAVLRMIELIGEDRVRAVERKTKGLCKMSVADLEDLVLEYELKLKAAKYVYEGKGISQGNGQPDKWIPESPRETK